MARPKMTEEEKKAAAKKRAEAKAKKELEKKKVETVEKVVQEPMEETEAKEDSFIDIESEMAEDEAVEEVEDREAMMAEKAIEDSYKNPVKVKTVKSTKQLDRNMLVRVASLVVGTLIYKSDRTGATYMFREFGTEDEIELFELQAMRSAYPKYLTQPWLVVLDDEVSNYLGIKDVYSKMVKPDQMDNFFKLKEHKMKSILENAPKGFKEAVLDMAHRKIKNKSLDSRAKIIALEEALSVELQEK